VALLAPAVLLDDHGDRHAHERPHVGDDLAVAPRDQHGLLLAGERRHHLRDARVARARHLLEALEQRDLRRLVEARTGSSPRYRCRAGPRLPSGADADWPWRPIARTAGGRFVEARPRDVVGIAQRLRSPDDGAHADAAVDAEAARLDDAFLEAPALEARVLEVEVGEVDVVLVDRADHLREARRRQARGREQQ
jgi:hypothetical protein